MDILLNEEEQMVRDAARGFLEAECSTTLARQMEEDELGYPPALWKQIADLGWIGMSLPEEYGGQALPLTYLGLVLEEVGRAVAPLPLLTTAVAADIIAGHGPDEMKQAVLPKVVSGDHHLSFAFQEVDPRIEAEAVSTRAVVDGDHFVVTGVKMFVDNFTISDQCLVVCRTNEGSTGRDGISLLLVDRDSAGITETALVSTAKDKQSKVVFEGVRVPRENLVGTVDEGWPIAQEMLDKATALLCTQMVGATRKDAEFAIEYSKSRFAFGRPIGSFQSIGHLCADMTIWVDGAQLLTYEALWALDQGRPASTEVSQAKAFSNDKCQAVVRSSQQIHGGIGFMMEFDLHLWYRRVAAWSMRLGTSFDHRARVARALIDQPGKVRLGEPVIAV